MHLIRRLIRVRLVSRSHFCAGSIATWVTGHISYRSMIVHLNQWTYVSVKGSILGPMLFNLYVSDLQNHLPSSFGSFQYADDTTIYSSCPARELQRCAQELNSTLNTVSSKSNYSHLALLSVSFKCLLRVKTRRRQNRCCYPQARCHMYIVYIRTDQPLQSPIVHYNM